MNGKGENDTLELYADPVVERTEDGDKKRTVVWQRNDGVLHTETTIIHKRVPAVGTILLTAFVFTIVGALIASLIFIARFTEIKTVFGTVSGIRTSSAATEAPDRMNEATPAPDPGQTPEPSKDVVLPTPAPVPARPGSNEGGLGLSLAELYNDCVPAVVIVESYERGQRGGTIHTGTGSGFFITSDGYILTNEHVVGGASEVKITTYTGERLDARVVGSDVKTDIAVLKVAQQSAISPVTIGDSSRVHTGDFVLAIGHPTGEELGFTATFGMVGAVDRSIVIEGVRNNYIQIDAAINPGNSGGPLFDMDGLVIGVNSAKTVVASYDENGEPINAEGLGFTLPINIAMEVAEGLIRDGGIVRPGIGLSTIFVNELTAAERGIPSGALVYTVTENGPAHKAGLYADDIIIKADEISITSGDALGDYIRTKSLGDSVTITFWRDGSERTAVVTVGDLNELGSSILDGAYGGSKYGIR